MKAYNFTPKEKLKENTTTAIKSLGFDLNFLIKKKKLRKWRIFAS